MRSIRLPILLAAVALITITGCDSLTGPSYEGDGPMTLGLDAELSARGFAASSTVGVCKPRDRRGFELVHVSRSEAVAIIARGGDLPGGGALDESCVSVQQTVPCPCFTARDLARSVEGSAPTPFLYFDTFNWYNLDPRRTEVRSAVTVDGALAENVAAMYITHGTGPELIPFCHRRGFADGPNPGETSFVSLTRQPRISEAETCRRILDAFAGDLNCQGPACGLPYTRAQLDPNYPAYNDDMLLQPGLHDDIRRTIADAARMMLGEPEDRSASPALR